MGMSANMQDKENTYKIIHISDIDNYIEIYGEQVNYK